MKGKVFKLFAVLIMICITVNVIQPEETEAYDYKDEYQIYLADYLSENTVAKSYLDHDINMPYRKYVEDRVNDPAWNALLGSWELATFNLSDVSEISFKLVGYYETILFDIIKTNRESDSELENIEKLVKGTHAGAFKKVYELYGDILSKDLKTLQENSAEYNKIMSTVNGLKEFENAFEMIGNVEDFVGYCTTLNDILYKCSVIETVVANNEYYSKIFLDMSKKANSEAMRMACENFSIICSQSISSEEIKMAFAGEAAAKEISKKVLSKVWSNVVEQCTGYGLAISVGQSMGKLSANLLFSTDENIEHYFSCRALYNFENQLSELTSDYKKTYNSLHSLESAKIYNTAFNLLLKTHLEGADYSKKIAELQYDKGAINQLFKYFNQEDYDGYMKTVGMIEDMIEDYIEFINVESYNDFVEYMAAVDDGNCFKNAAADISPEPVTVTASDYNKAVLQVQSVSDSYYGMDFTKSQTLEYDMEIFDDVEMSADVDLNGHTLTIRGDLIQTAGKMKINNGTLNVGGDYKIQKISTTGVTSDSDGVLRMENKSDSVNISGDFVMQSSTDCYSSSDYNYLSAGTMTIGGDFYQYNGKYGNNFVSETDGNHVVIIKGERVHNLYFDSEGYSHFSNLKTEDNATIKFTGKFYGFKLCQDLVIEGDTKLTGDILDLNGYTLTINGDFDVASNLNVNKGHLIVNGNLKVNYNTDCGKGTIDVKENMTQNADIDMNSGKINVSGDLRQTAGKMKINNGTLNVGGDYKIQKISVAGITLNSSGILRMENDSDTINIDGDFVMQSSTDCYSSSDYNYLSAGTMTIGGDFYQYNGDSSNFCPGVDHIVVLNGKEPQKVYFESESSYINVLVLMNPKSNYTFAPKDCYKTLIEKAPVVTTTTTSVTTTVSTTVTKVTTTSQKNTTTSETSNTSVTTVKKPATSATTSVTTTMMSTKVSATSTTKKSTTVSATSTTKKSTITPVTSTGNSVTTTVKTEPKLLGDANNDGKVTIADIVLMQKYLTNADVDIHYEAIDMNEDGKFNVFDLIVIKRMMLNAK